jgi:hypothetical protein
MVSEHRGDLTLKKEGAKWKDINHFFDPFYWKEV